ncbi:PEP-CTERM sorting domain-containing protein [Roseateles sp. P5_E4]
MQIKTLAAAAALLVSGLASATTTLNAGSYSVTYDETTTGFGWISSWFTAGGGAVGFDWSVDPSVNVTSVGGAAMSATFAIPDFTISVNPGYALSGAVMSSLGNIVYAQNGGATTSITATGMVSLDGGAPMALPSAPLTQTVINPFLGYFSGSTSVPVGAFSSFAVTGASITLNASGGSFAAIGAQPQNKLSFAFTANPVPEPETYALLLAGLGVVGLLARRRRPC